MNTRNTLLFILISFFIFLYGCETNKNIEYTKDYIDEKTWILEKIKLLEQQKNKFTLPNWVKELNILLPKWMDLNTWSSYQTTQEVDGFDSMYFVYEWDYETAMKQAEELAREAGITVNEEFKLAQNIMQKMWSWASDEMKKLAWDLKWVVYSNYSITKNPESDHIISISVDEDGTLEIEVTDRKNMQNIAKDKINLINNN